MSSPLSCEATTVKKSLPRKRVVKFEFISVRHPVCSSENVSLSSRKFAALRPTLPVNPVCPGPACGKTVPFLVKLNPSGSKLLYGTFLAGTGTGSSALTLALDRRKNIYVAGLASATDLPVNNMLFSACYAEPQTVS